MFMPVSRHVVDDAHGGSVIGLTRSRGAHRVAVIIAVAFALSVGAPAGLEPASAEPCTTGLAEGSGDCPPVYAKIDSAPSGTYRYSDARFAFHAETSDGSPAPTRFECSLDGGAWEPCGSPRSYKGIENGWHTFDVVPVVEPGYVAVAEGHAWTADGEVRSDLNRPVMDASNSLLIFDTAHAYGSSGDTNGVRDVYMQRQGNSLGFERLSLPASGGQGNGASWGASSDASGMVVAFLSDASNLVSGDTNAATDVFVRDQMEQTTERVSVGALGEQVPAGASAVSVSGNGRYIAFVTRSSIVPPGGSADSNGVEDVYVYDREQRKTVDRASVSGSGLGGSSASVAPAISEDGRYVAFASSSTNLVPADTNAAQDVFVRDRNARSTTRVSVTSSGGQANGPSVTPSISDDGRYVAFASDASNFTSSYTGCAGNTFTDQDTNGRTDIFRRDRNGGTNSTYRVSKIELGYPCEASQQPNGPSYKPSISANGSRIAFESEASNLTCQSASGPPACDSNGRRDVYLFTAGATGGSGRVMSSKPPNYSTAATGTSKAAAVSENGRYVAFETDAPDVFRGRDQHAVDIAVHIFNTDNINADCATGEGLIKKLWPLIVGGATYAIWQLWHRADQDERGEDFEKCARDTRTEALQFATDRAEECILRGRDPRVCELYARLVFNRRHAFLICGCLARKEGVPPDVVCLPYEAPEEPL